MNLYLYSSHHFLPFWHNPKNPVHIFDLGKFSDFSFIDDDTKKKEPVTRHWVWPILLGLRNVPANASAHISFIFDVSGEMARSPKRVWVQITTNPKLDESGAPLVVGEDRNVLVQHLWGGDNTTHHPYDFLDEETKERCLSLSLEDRIKFWSDFFHLKISNTKECDLEEARKKIFEANQTIDMWEEVLPS